MFFKKKALALFLFILIPWTAHSQEGAGFFLQSPCFTDMKNYYPYFLKGQLNLKEQNRFFDCTWGVLDLIVNKKVFVHDPSRDHFTYQDIEDLLHYFLAYEKQASKELAKKLLFIKRLLVGGSIHQVKDKELVQLLNLIEDYKDSYYIIHKQIPVLTKTFLGEPILAEERAKTLEQLRKSLQLLQKAYQRENVVYSIEDIYKYGDYLNVKDPKVKHSLWFVYNLLKGVLYPKKEIKKADWTYAFNSLHNSLNLYLYYKTYFTEGLSPIKQTYLHLESLKLFINTLESNDNSFHKTGFPAKHLDEMLFSVVSLWGDSLGENSKAFLSRLKDKESIRFITRALLCFSLDTRENKPCKSEWKKDGPITRVSFSDSEFNFFETQITTINKKSLFFVESTATGKIKRWASSYQFSLRDIHEGNYKHTAQERQFDHWLDPFFQWNGEQIVFGGFSLNKQKSKSAQLLMHHAFLSLFLHSYMPEGYFYSSEQKIPFKVWKNIMSDLLPLAAILNENTVYHRRWRQSLYDLFQLSDLFLNSSNQDGFLNIREILDVSVNLSSALKSSSKLFPKMLNTCQNKGIELCAAQIIIEDPDVLAAYPRFKDHIFKFKRELYQDKISKTLKVSEPLTRFSFLPFFLLIQISELNYHYIDTNNSFDLDSKELLFFADRFKNKLSSKLPHVFNDQQALSYMLYSFQTGHIPFFTGDLFEPVKFTHWHLNSDKQIPYLIGPNDFHFLVFDFYDIYHKTN